MLSCWRRVYLAPGQLACLPPRPPTAGACDGQWCRVPDLRDRDLPPRAFAVRLDGVRAPESPRRRRVAASNQAGGSSTSSSRHIRRCRPVRPLGAAEVLALTSGKGSSKDEDDAGAARKKASAATRRTSRPKMQRRGESRGGGRLPETADDRVDRQPHRRGGTGVRDRHPGTATRSRP